MCTIIIFTIYLYLRKRQKIDNQKQRLKLIN